jgi:hypothetical protein
MRLQSYAEAHASTSDTSTCVTRGGCSSDYREAPVAEEGPSRAISSRPPLLSPGVSPPVATEPELLRAIYKELRELSESMRGLEARLNNQIPAQATRAVSVEVAQALLGCGRSQLFALLKSGALSRAPKVGKSVMITLASLEAFQERGSREPVPRLQRHRVGRDFGRDEKEAILSLIRRR